MSSGKLKVIEGKKRREEQEDMEDSVAEHAITEAKGRPTPGRRNQSAEVEQRGNFLTRPIFGFIDYLRDVRAELDKVTWPTREDTIRLTRIVLATTIAASILLGIISAIFTELFIIGLRTPALLFAVIVLMVGGAVYAIMRSNRSSGGY